MTFLGAKDFGLEASLGRATGYLTLNKFGCAPDCDANIDTDVWDGADGITSTKVWVAPTQARMHDIASSSADDDGDPVGPGIRTVEVFGLIDWDSPEVGEVVVLNGTSSVPTANSYVIIHRMIGRTFGSLGVSAGTITATAQIDATITAMIAAGQGQTMMAIYGVPSTQEFRIRHVTAAALRVAGAVSVKVDWFLFVKENAGQPDSAFIAKEVRYFTDISPLNHEYMVPKGFSGPLIVKIQVQTDTINVRVAAGFDAYLVEK